MVWTPAQTGAFLDAVEGERLYPLYHLIAYRGLRRSEACGLRWPDTDLDAAEIAILSQLVQNGWDVEEDSPKTEASDDTVTLDRETVAVLRAWRKAQLAERLAWGEAWAGTGRVFTRENGQDLHPARATTVFEYLRAPGPAQVLTDSRLLTSLRRSGRVGRLGLEPRTDGLKVRCSTIELTPREPARPAPSDEAYRLRR
jgi:integrase